MLGSESKSSLVPINDKKIIIITEKTGVKNRKKKKGLLSAHSFGESKYLYKKKMAKKEEIKGINTFTKPNSNIPYSRKKKAKKPSGSSSPKMEPDRNSKDKATTEGIIFFTIQLLF